MIVLALATVAGLLAAAMAAQWLHTQAGANSPVVVAVGDIPLGTPLEAGMLTTMAWPAHQEPHGAARDPGALLGRVTRTALTRHEPVLEGKLAAVGSRGGLSAAISPGKRAITVKVNEVMGVAGFALPGGLVDVMVHTQSDDTRFKPSAAVSRIVLERILVLAVAQDASRDATAPRVAQAVTLEVTPEQAEKLDLARSVGSLSLVLRNPTDGESALTAGARKSDLLPADEGPSPPIQALAGAPASPRKTGRAAGSPLEASEGPHRRGRDARAAAVETDAAGGADPASVEVIRGVHRSMVVW